VPLLDLPVVLQRTDHSCGAAVFACVTHYWELKKRRIKADPWNGKHPMELEPDFRKLGYFTFSGTMSLDHLRAVTAAGTPVCGLIQSGGCGHWVVVRGVARNRVYVMDPAEGLHSISANEWEDRWFDADRQGTVFRRHGLAVWC
jgi:predicted double-glycine peptidase